MKSEFPSRVHHKHNLYSMIYMHCASALPTHVLRWAGMRFQGRIGRDGSAPSESFFCYWRPLPRA
jgi:hypothetical protein